MTGARFVCHCILGSPMLSLSFSNGNNISVDADLIGETSCLHGAIPLSMMEKMNPPRFSVAFARFILRFVDVIVTRPRLRRASVWGDLVLALSVMIMRIERRGCLQPPYENIRLGVPLLCHIVTNKGT